MPTDPSASDALQIEDPKIADNFFLDWRRRILDRILPSGYESGYCMRKKIAVQPQASRRRLTPEERRQEILDALRAELTEHGFHSLSVPMVVRRAGTAQGSFYRYYEDLAAALIALFNERVQPKLLKALLCLSLARVRCADDLETQLSEYFRHLAELIRSEGPVLRAAVSAAAGDPGKAGEYCREQIEQMRAVGERELALVSGRKPFRRVDPEWVSHMVVGMTLSTVAHTRDASVDPTRLAKEMARFEAWGLLDRAAIQDRTSRRRRPR